MPTVYPPTRRLDLGATYEKPHQEGHRFHSSWTFSVYNALGRENPYSITLQKPTPTTPPKRRPCKLPCFKMVPSATYNFSF